MCIFCEIIKNNIPCFEIYENEHCLCFLDISQATKGHTLVVLKRHAENFLEVKKEEYASILDACNQVSLILKTKLGVDNFNYLNNCGTLASQSVMHYHMHVIPRYENDNVLISFTENSPSKEELQRLSDFLTKED